MMDTFIDGLMRGADFGLGLADKVGQHRLRAETIGIKNTKLTPEVGADGKPAGFRFGDKVFREKPTEELLAAERYKQMAGANLVYGDPNKALALEEAARTQRKAALDDIIQRAVMVGTPEAMVGAYSLMDDGVVPMFRRGSDGRPQAYTIDGGQEKILLEGVDDKDFVNNAMKFLSPDLSLKMAELEWKRKKEMAEYNKTLADTGYTQARTGETGLDSTIKLAGLEGLPTSFADRQGQHKQEVAEATQRIELLKEAAKNDPRLVPVLEAELAGLQRITGGGATGVSLDGLPAGADVVVRVAQEEGVDPAVALSIWMQESSGSTDLSKTGEVIKKGKNAGHYARGPWQIMTFHGEIPQDFEGQTRWAMKHLKERGIGGYYGTGKAPAGHPTTEDYQSQVMKRAEQYRRLTLGDAAQGLAAKDPKDSLKIQNVSDAQTVQTLIEEKMIELAQRAGYSSSNIPEEVLQQFLDEATRHVHGGLTNAATIRPQGERPPPKTVEQTRAEAQAMMKQITERYRQDRGY